MTSDAPSLERRILVVDDSESVQRDYRKALGALPPGDAVAAKALDDLEADLFDAPLKPAVAAPRFAVTTVPQGQDAVRAAATAVKEGRPFSVAFVDMRMPPGWDGLQTIERLWQVAPDLQCVLCTAFSDYSWEEIALRLGTRDNLLLLRKPFDSAEALQIATALSEKWALAKAAGMRMEELERVVAERTEQLREATRLDQRRMDQLESLVAERTVELRRAAMTDKLTGLPNRALFNDRLAQAVDNAAKGVGGKFALLYLDFDRFKVINDSLGHQAGDRLLISISERLTSVLRANDFVASGDRTAARLGGDEFVVLLTDLPELEVAERVARRLLDSLAPPHDVGGHRIHCTASIGVTTSAFDYRRAEDVVRDADTAMYRAKAAGRSRVVLFDPPMHREALERLLLESELRRAVDHDLVGAHFQPIVRIADGAVAGFEGLARWFHPERGLIMPGEFIPVAEETGVIRRLGASMMRRCFLASAAWRARVGDACPYVTVNLSPKQLMDSEFLTGVDELLRETGALAADVRFEVTENYLIADDDGAPEKLRRLRDRGFGIFIDDFGTGYSSLSSLHRFPFTGMKIDRSFLESSQSVRKHAAVLDAMTTLARNLGIPVIAEGVENSRQLALLETVRCDCAQGFYFARPMSLDNADVAVAEGLPNPLAAARA